MYEAIKDAIERGWTVVISSDPSGDMTIKAMQAGGAKWAIETLPIVTETHMTAAINVVTRKYR